MKRRPPPRSQSPHRRALSQVQGEVQERGDTAVSARLAAAWNGAEGEGRDLTHGIHPWPARAHPTMVRLLIDTFSKAGGVVADPFSGSGTVVVEALARGRRGLGFDIHPIGVRSAHAKCFRLPGDERKEIEAAAANITRRSLRGDDDQLDGFEEERKWYTPQVWEELSSIALGIERLRRPAHRFLLNQVLSSILIKVSKRAAETDSRRGDGVRPGIASGLFRDRTTELCLGMAALRHAARDTPTPIVGIADARALPIRDHSVDLIITSPPYLGTYDYGETQELRAALLGVDLTLAIQREIGTRQRATASPREEEERYHDDLRRSLMEMRRVLKPASYAIILIGDSTVQGQMIAADDILVDVAQRARFDVIAAASQSRPATVRGTEREVSRSGRYEHLIALRPV